MRMNRSDILIAKALRAYASRLIDSALADPESVPKEEGQALDRALRSCRGIIDIDRVWVRWRYIGRELGWLTNKELITTKKGCWYPPETYIDVENENSR